MTKCSVCRKILLFALVAALAGAWPASAAGSLRENIPSARVDEWALPEIFDRFWSFLQRLEAKDGCRIDPFGRCEPAPSPVSQSKDGCHIDPWGRCLP